MSEYSNPFTDSNPNTSTGDAESTPQADERRGRIIVVADPSLDRDACVDMLRDATARSITAVDNFFEAIGEIAGADMRSAPDAVVASVQSFGSRAAEYADAFRQADPSIAVLAILPAANRDEEAATPDANEASTATDAEIDVVESCVDAMLTLPVTRLEFERAIQTAGMSKRGPRVPIGENEVEMKSTPTVNTDSESRQESEEAVTFARQLIRERLEAGDAPDERMSDPPPAPAASSTAGDTGDTINDVELLDRILRAPGALASTLELAIIDRSGCDDVRILRDFDELEASDVEQIRYGETVLGVLRAPSMSSEVRTKYALWAGRYLAALDTLNHWKRLAYTDDLTGAMNRRYFHSVLQQTLDRARSLRTCVTILLFDIDDFKQFNDQYGHTAGDEILREIVKLLQSVIRPTDRVCRIGGDEFVVIFFDPNGEREIGSSHPRDIEQIVSRFQQQIAAHQFPKLGRDAPGRLTISGGLATFPWDGHDVHTLFDRADQAALEAKRSGKNAIVVGENDSIP